MLITQQGDRDFVKVLDFGLAKVTAQMLPVAGEGPGQALTKQGTVCGTPKYMAPEQCISAPVDGRTDLYALGLILYEMLTGVSPFGSKDILTTIRHQLTTPTPPMATVAPGILVPAAVEALVMRLTDKRPEHRYPSATAVLAALAEAVGKPSTLPQPARAPAPQPAPAAPESAGAGQTVASVDMLSIGGAALDGPHATGPSPAPPPGTPARAGGPASALLARLPAPVQKTPLLLLVPVALMALVLFLLLRPGTPPESIPSAAKGRAVKPPSGGAQASQAQLDSAIGVGLPALLDLAKQYPQDARVQRALAHTYMAQQNGVEALRGLAKVIALKAELVQPGELMQAAMMGMRTAESADSVIALLSEEFGTRGVDVLYTLAEKPGPLRFKIKLNLSLGKAAVRAQASPSAAVALDLRAADSCTAKRALLARAAKDGDQRALQQLKPLLQTRNCGRYGLADCWSCLRQDEALQGTISAIESRASLPN